MIRDLILKNRSYRRFYQDAIIDRSTLTELVDLARLSPSARNAQPLKYFLSSDSATNALIFPHLSWAGYLTDWDGPEEGERPSAYIIVLNDNTIASNYFCDEGIASQSILLGAVEKGLGGCIVASVKRNELQQALNLPTQYAIVHVIALGKPKEEVVLETIHGNDVKYWRDRDQKHHVPKRSLNEIIVL
ncbi:nitroreductase [Breznakibacter xylanolyticus]|uniref:Nitroreductase n=1 Tax=Breznakibacter xylanolyticus TaxID=990 RepID=A0A2W7PBA9_9BACT|nr:nitroreductase family protein [Breznakibacter xylanolyticus]MBN2744233.1 nitroreductase family protein [Marinilabiliaceae bacterium]PZX20622.1 nitroreductase [Breznakibacter xylanolyticus]